MLSLTGTMLSDAVTTTVSFVFLTVPVLLAAIGCEDDSELVPDEPRLAIPMRPKDQAARAEKPAQAGQMREVREERRMLRYRDAYGGYRHSNTGTARTAEDDGRVQQVAEFEAEQTRSARAWLMERQRTAMERSPERSGSGYGAAPDARDLHGYRNHTRDRDAAPDTLDRAESGSWSPNPPRDAAPYMQGSLRSQSDRVPTLTF